MTVTWADPGASWADDVVSWSGAPVGPPAIPESQTASLWAQSRRVVPSVTVWRGDQLLADDVPVVEGSLADADRLIGRRGTLVVPATLTPSGPLSPFAPYGQTVTLAQTVTVGGQTVTVTLGTLLVAGWESDGQRVRVELVDTATRLDDARFVSPRVPPSSATFASELVALGSAAGLGVTVDDTLTDRALPRSLSASWVEERARAVADVAAAWPAFVHTDRDGVLVARRPADPAVDTPAREWVHGTAEAYVRLESSGLRDDVYNAVVVRGQTTNGADVFGVAYDTRPTSPTQWGGPFGRRPRFHYSPLVTSTAQAQATAQAMLSRELRRTAQLVVIAPPDPTLDVGTVAAVTDRAGVRRVGVLVECETPLVASGGPGRYVVGVDGS